MKLQIAFDLTDLDKALNIAKSVEKYCDFFEIGTLLLFKHGEKSITEFKKEFPNKPLFVDAKIVDRSSELINFLAQAGADWITILAGAGRSTIHSACSLAHNLGKKVMLDLADASSPGQAALEAKSLGVDALLYHKSQDEEIEFIDRWEMIKGNTSLPVFISSNLTRDNIAEFLTVGASTVIVSSSITKAANPEEEAAYYSSVIKQQS